MIYIEYDDKGLFSCFTDGENHVEENYKEVTEELYNKLLEFDMMNSFVKIYELDNKVSLGINDLAVCFNLKKRAKSELEILKETVEKLVLANLEV